MPEQAHGIDQQEQEEIGRIAIDYFQKTLGSEKLVQKALSSLAHAVKDEGAKLVHLGNVLFLILAWFLFLSMTSQSNFQTFASTLCSSRKKSSRLWLTLELKML